MAYGDLHRFLLRSVASRGVMLINEAENIINTSSGNEESSLQDLIKEINDEIRPFQQSIKITNDEFTSEDVLIFLSLGYDDATKSQNVFSGTELEYFRILIEQIMTTDSRQITGIHAMNLVSSMKASFTKTDAQKLLNTWCRMRYLDNEETNYALGIRAIHEFEGYLRENMPDTIEECCLCKQIVFRGYNCLSCGLAVHTRCLNRYLEKMDKWPCCKADFSSSQLEQLNCAGSRHMHTQRLDATQPIENQTITELAATEQLEDTMVEQSQIIPEISQRVTRKRKRQCE